MIANIISYINNYTYKKFVVALDKLPTHTLVINRLYIVCNICYTECVDKAQKGWTLNLRDLLAGRLK